MNMTEKLRTLEKRMARIENTMERLLKLLLYNTNAGNLKLPLQTLRNMIKEISEEICDRR